MPLSNTPEIETDNPAYGKPLHYAHICRQLAEAQEQLRAKNPDNRYNALTKRITELLDRRKKGSYTEEQFIIRLKEALQGHTSAQTQFQNKPKPPPYGTIYDTNPFLKAAAKKLVKVPVLDDLAFAPAYTMEKQADGTLKPVYNPPSWKDLF